MLLRSRDAEPGGLLAWQPPDNAPEGELQKGWHALWQTVNLLFPLARFWAGSNQGCAWSTLHDAPLVRGAAHGMDLAWIEVAEYAAREVQGWMEALSRHGVEAPVVGYELLDEKGRVVAEAELAWVSRRVAVLVGAGSEEAAASFHTHGWRCFVATDAEIDGELLMALQVRENSHESGTQDRVVR